MTRDDRKVWPKVDREWVREWPGMNQGCQEVIRRCGRECDRVCDHEVWPGGTRVLQGIPKRLSEVMLSTEHLGLTGMPNLGK